MRLTDILQSACHRSSHVNINRVIIEREQSRIGKNGGWLRIGSVTYNTNKRRPDTVQRWVRQRRCDHTLYMTFFPQTRRSKDAVDETSFANWSRRNTASARDQRTDNHNSSTLPIRSQQHLIDRWSVPSYIEPKLPSHSFFLSFVVMNHNCSQASAIFFGVLLRDLFKVLLNFLEHHFVNLYMIFLPVVSMWPCRQLVGFPTELFHPSANTRLEGPSAWHYIANWPRRQIVGTSWAPTT